MSSSLPGHTGPRSERTDADRAARRREDRSEAEVDCDDIFHCPDGSRHELEPTPEADPYYTNAGWVSYTHGPLLINDSAQADQ